MPVSAVYTYLKQALDQQPLPVVGTYAIPALKAVIAPATIDTQQEPRVYIHGARWHEERLGGPARVSTKQRLYRIPLTLRLILIPASLKTQGTDAETVMAAIVDTVTFILNNQPKSGVMAHDPLTGRSSQLGLIGDEQDGELQGPWSLADQRTQLWGAALTIHLKELFLG